MNPTPPHDRPSYWEYLRIEDLLSLQDGLEGDEAALSDHEVLFIVVHQVFELWFKLVLRELTTARNLLNRDPVPDLELSKTVRCLRRVKEILDRGADHFRVMETLTTRDFLDFRDKLLPASGFQSAQFREVEILMGLREQVRLHLGAEGSYLRALRNPDGSESPASRRVRERLDDTPTLREAVDEWLHRTPLRGSHPEQPGDAQVVQDFIEDFVACHAKDIGDVSVRAARQTETDTSRRELADRYEQEMQQARAFLLAQDVPVEQRARRSRIRAALAFIESYRELPLLAWPRELVDSLLTVEQALIIFRQRHARMVEVEIGRRIGTGGSSGVDYLDGTALSGRIFSDIWAVRTYLVAKSAVPKLDDAQRDFYGFRFDG